MKKNLKIYFAGSIRGGRDKVNDYKLIVDFLEKYGVVLDKHVANPKLTSNGEKISEEEIYERDIKWINECDLVIAEVTNPSLGVGYEIAYAEKLNKKIVCIAEENINLSAMIKGNNNIILNTYNSISELEKLLLDYLK